MNAFIVDACARIYIYHSCVADYLEHLALRNDYLAEDLSGLKQISIENLGFFVD